MNKKLTIIGVVAVILVIIVPPVLDLCGTSWADVSDGQIQNHITVKKQLDAPLEKGSMISVSVARAGTRRTPDGKRVAVYDSALSFLEADLRISLKDMGFIPKFDKAAVRWGLEGEFTETWGRLVLGRNGQVHMVYYGIVNLKLKNNETEDIVGEIEYRRPRFLLPPTTLGEEMTKRLMQGSTEAP